MKASVDGTILRVDWFYKDEVNALHGTPTVATTCVIKGPDGNTINEAIVHKMHKDVNNKDAARRFSLTKALSVFPKPVRKQIWESYNNR